MKITKIKKEINKNIKPYMKSHGYKAIKRITLTINYKEVIFECEKYSVRKDIESFCRADKEITEKEAIALNVEKLLDDLNDKIPICQSVISVKELRSKTGLSQSEFAMKFHLNKGTLANWEQGFRKTPEYILFMIETIIDQENELNNIENHINNNETTDHFSLHL